MSIRNTSKWSEAENIFNQLHGHSGFSLFGFDLASSMSSARDDTDLVLAELLETCPEYFPAWFQRAERRFRMGNDKEGEEFFDLGFRNFCDIVTDPEEFCNLLFHWLENLENMLRFTFVARVLEQAIELFPEEASLYDELAFCIMQTANSEEQHNKAIAYQQKAMDDDPDSDYYISNMGWLYLMVGEYAKAEELFQNAVDYNHENETAFENLEMTEYMRKHGMSYQQYLLRPAQKKEINSLLESGETEEALEIGKNFNQDRLLAFKHHHLKEAAINPHELLGMNRVMETFLEVIINLVEEDVSLVEELDVIAANMKFMLSVILDEAEFMDSGTLEFFGKSIGVFYDFLASQDLVDNGSVDSFKKDLEPVIHSLAANLEEYYVILRDVTLSESEREEKINPFWTL